LKSVVSTQPTTSTDVVKMRPTKPTAQKFDDRMSVAFGVESNSTSVASTQPTTSSSVVKMRPTKPTTQKFDDRMSIAFVETTDEPPSTQSAQQPPFTQAPNVGVQLRPRVKKTPNADK
jgi:hypothetical protein